MHNIQCSSYYYSVVTIKYGMIMIISLRAYFMWAVVGCWPSSFSSLPGTVQWLLVWTHKVQTGIRLAATRIYLTGTWRWVNVASGRAVMTKITRKMFISQDSRVNVWKKHQGDLLDIKMGYCMVVFCLFPFGWIVCHPCSKLKKLVELKHIDQIILSPNIYKMLKTISNDCCSNILVHRNKG